jgi:hypothetical protein
MSTAVASVLSVASVSSPSIAESQPDAELIALGRQWEQAVKVVNEAERRLDKEEVADFDIRLDEMNDLEDAILRARASTIEGLVVKARLTLREIDLYYDSADVSAKVARNLAEAIVEMSGAAAPAPGV